MDIIAKANDQAVTIRFPKQVLVALRKAAKSSGRSRNTEAVLRLANSLGINDKTGQQAKDLAA